MKEGDAIVCLIARETKQAFLSTRKNGASILWRGCETYDSGLIGLLFGTPDRAQNAEWLKSHKRRVDYTNGHFLFE